MCSSFRYAYSICFGCINSCKQYLKKQKTNKNLNAVKRNRAFYLKIIENCLSFYMSEPTNLIHRVQKKTRSICIATHAYTNI